MFIPWAHGYCRAPRRRSAGVRLSMPQLQWSANIRSLFQEMASRLRSGCIFHTGCGHNLRRARFKKSTQQAAIAQLLEHWPTEVTSFKKLQHANLTEQANEIMNVSLQNEPLPSNVSIKSSRYRVTRNLIYHSHKRSPVKVRVQKV